MPKMPLTLCSFPGCNVKVQRGRCEKHRQQQCRQVEDRRLSSHQRGYTWRWRKLAKAFLAENPLCVHCLADGVTEPATEVDHIIPHRGDPELFWDQDNLQGLCKRHHSAKTAEEGNRWG